MNTFKLLMVAPVFGYDNERIGETDYSKSEGIATVCRSLYRFRFFTGT